MAHVRLTLVLLCLHVLCLAPTSAAGVEIDVNGMIKNVGRAAGVGLEAAKELADRAADIAGAASQVAANAGETAATIAAKAGQKAAAFAAEAGETASSIGMAATEASATAYNHIPSLRDVEASLNDMKNERSQQVAEILTSKAEAMVYATFSERLVEVCFVLGLMLGLLLPWCGLVYLPMVGASRTFWMSFGFHVGASSTGLCALGFASRALACEHYFNVDLWSGICIHVGSIILLGCAAALQQGTSKADPAVAEAPPGDASAASRELLTRLEEVNGAHKQLVAKAMERIGDLETKLDGLAGEMEALRDISQ